jgi:type VI secretion system protein ImpK
MTIAETSRPASRPDPLAPARNIVLLFQEILTAAVRIRANRHRLTTIEGFRTHVRSAFDSAEASTQKSGYSREEARMAVLAVVAFLDETILVSTDPAFLEWQRRPMQEELFGGHVAGETFFQNLNQLLTDDDVPRNADLLDIYYLCLVLGYRGRYSVGREKDLKSVIDRVAEKIGRIRGITEPASAALIPPVEAIPSTTDPWLRAIAFAAVTMLLVTIALFTFYKVRVNAEWAEIRTMVDSVSGRRP